MKLLNPKKISLLALGGFVLYYTGLFILFPLQNSFIGNSDTIVHVAYFYEHLHNFLSFFSSQDYGSAYYPMSGIGPYMETYYGETLLFFIGKLFTGSDLWACFFLYVIMYALNGWSVYLLSNYYTKHSWAAFVAGIIFSSSCFMMSTLELMNGVAFFCIPISILFLEKFFETSQHRFLFLSTVVLALESYFSGYHFFMGSLVWLALLVTRSKHVLKLDFKKAIIGVIPSIVLIIPLLLKILSPDIADAHNPMKGLDDLYIRFSMSLKSFVTSIPNNLIYPRPDEVSYAVKTSYRGNLGILCLLLFLFGIIRKSPRRYTYLIILIMATLVSFGPYTYIGGSRVTMPTALIYKSDFLGTFFRMPGRAFVISNFIIALFCGIGIKAILTKFKVNSLIFAGILILIFTIENQAIPPYVYSHKNLINIPDEYNLIRSEEGELRNIADFPSSLFTETGYINGVSEFTREYRYHYWQTKHHQNIINGSASYYPQTRMENGKLMMSIAEEGNLIELINKNDLDNIVFHKDLVLQNEEYEVLDYFRNSPLLTEVLDGERLVIFEVIH